MNYVKKMILVDPKRLSTAASEPTIETDAHLQVLRQLHREMQDVLNNTDTNDLDKVTAYNQILQRYLEYQEKYKRPKPVPVSLSHQSEYATASTGVMTVFDELLRVVPKNTRKQAETPRGLKTPQPSTRRLAKGRASPLKQWDTL